MSNNTLSALALVTKSAVSEGKSRDAVILAVKNAGGDTPEVRLAYIVGRMMVSLGIGETDARACLDKKGNGAKTDGPTRTEKEERAYGAARVAWDSIKRAAGIAASPKKSEAKRKPVTVHDQSNAPITIPALVVPRVKGVPDIATYALALCANLRKFRSVNSKVFTGDDGAFYRDEFDGFIARVEARAIKRD